jgi:ketosteroid isomerase-like protein
MIHRKELPAYKAGSNGVSVNRSDETDSALSLSWASDVAYAYGLQHMTGTKIDGEKVDL